MTHIGYLKRENKKHKDGYEYLEVYTTPTIKERCWWFKREVGWVDSPRFVLVRNRFGWTYLLESNHKDLIIFDEYKPIIDHYWGDADE